MPDPPTFSGSDSKQTLDDWLAQISLYCSATGIVTDNQKIVTALTRIRAPASTYLRSYFDKNAANQALGTWDNFVQDLRAIYGQKDPKKAAEEELAELWDNKELARKDFIKFAEQFRTLANYVGYEDKVLITKLRNVIPRDLKAVVAGFRASKAGIPDKWNDLLETLLEIWKELHADKASNRLFGNKDNGKGKDDNKNNSGKGKSKEANSAEKSKSKETRHCKICAAKGLSRKATTHNTDDCYDKPGNEGKRPANPSSSLSSNNQKSGNSGSKGKTGNGGKFKSLHARIMELSKEVGQLAQDEDGSASPAGNVEINTARIREWDESDEPAQAQSSRIDDSSKESSGPTTGSKKISHLYSADFTKGL